MAIAICAKALPDHGAVILSSARGVTSSLADKAIMKRSRIPVRGRFSIPLSLWI